jgi:hypothetical protein
MNMILTNVKNHSESYAWKVKRNHAPAKGVCRRWPQRPVLVDRP